MDVKKPIVPTYNSREKSREMINSYSNTSMLKDHKDPIFKNKSHLGNLDISCISKSKSVNHSHIRSERDPHGNKLHKAPLHQDFLFISQPYISEFDKELQNYEENKKKWIVKQDFSKYIGKASTSKPKYIPNYVNLTPSDPPSNYQFRNVVKEKWVSPKKFFV